MTSFVLEVICILKHSQIPVINDTEWINLSMKDLQKKALQYYREYHMGKVVLNSNRRFQIKLPMTGARHAVWGRNPGYEKLVVFKQLPEILKYASIASVRLPFHKRNDDTMFFIRMKSYAKVNGKKIKLMFDVRLTESGNYYYDHNIEVKKYS